MMVGTGGVKLLLTIICNILVYNNWFTCVQLLRPEYNEPPPSQLAPGGRAKQFVSKKKECKDKHHNGNCELRVYGLCLPTEGKFKRYKSFSRVRF